MWKHVAEWKGRWAQDQKLWGSIPTAGHMQKCQANLIPVMIQSAELKGIPGV